MCLGLALLRKYLTDDYRQMFPLDDFIFCDKTWREPGYPPGATPF